MDLSESIYVCSLSRVAPTALLAPHGPRRGGFHAEGLLPALGREAHSGVNRGSPAPPATTPETRDSRQAFSAKRFAKSGSLNNAL